MPVFNSRSMSVGVAKVNSKIVNAELLKANPSGIIDFFEIDLEDILFDSLMLAEKVGTTGLNDSDRVFRFHNCLNFTTKSIIYQGKEYLAAPIYMSDVEYTTKGSIPRPKLKVATSIKSAGALSLFKNAVLDLGDITSAKLTRTRTFVKFIDAANTPSLTQQIPNFEPNPNALLRLDIFYFFRKSAEDEISLEFELASKMDVDSIQLPKRTILQDKCVWKYRGEGCCYEAVLTKKTHGVNRSSPPPAAKNSSLIGQGAPPVADNNDILFVKQKDALNYTLPEGTNLSALGKWQKTLNPKLGQYVFIEKNGIKYYFVCILDNPDNIAPPNILYWKPDQCSKTIIGCSLRFEATIGLPFGGFAAARKSSQ